MRFSKFFIALALVMCLAPAQIALAQSGSMTLEQAVQRALDTHPQVQAQLDVINAAEYARKEAMRPFFPRVDAWLAYGREYSDTPTLRAAGEDSVTLWRREASLTARQILWDGMDAYNHTKQMGETLQAEKFRMGDIREVMALRVVNAYLDVLQQRVQVKLAEDYLAQTQKRMREIKDRLRGGVGRSSDVDQVESRLAQAQTRVLNRKRDLEAADAVFLEVVGVKPPADLATPTMPGSLPGSLEATVDTALKNHPAMMRREAELRAVRRAVKRTEGRFWPTLSLVGSVSRNRNIDGVEGDNNDASVMGVMAWNLFNGLADISERNRNMAVVRENMKGIEALRRIIVRNAVVSWNAYQAALSDMPQLEKAVISNKAVVDAFEAQFGLGQRTLLDLLNVEASLYESRAARTQGQFTVLSEGFGLLASCAKVLPSLGIKMNTAAVQAAPAKAAPATAAAPAQPAAAPVAKAAPAAAPAAPAAQPAAAPKVKKWAAQ